MATVSPTRECDGIPSLGGTTEQDLLQDTKPKHVTSVKHCCETFWFVFATLVLIADYITDFWVIVYFAVERHSFFLGFAILFLVVANCVTAVMYSVQLKAEGTQRALTLFGCMFLNFPFQIGIILHRLDHTSRSCRQCCSRSLGRDEADAHRPKPIVNANWKFAKLKLIQGMFQSAPELMINLLHILAYGEVHTIQYVSAAVSFTSVILGIVLHEKERKEHTRGYNMGPGKIACILTYKSLIIVARMVAMINFIYFFGQWLAAILVPHFLLIFAFFTYLYHQIWKVDYYNICLHSLYSLLAYFPIHNDYRPEGEIVMYYILYMIENVLMVALPYALAPHMKVREIYSPGSRYYLGMTLLVLLGSAAGLICMAVYYFVLHKSRQTIRHTHLSWLARLCEWSTRPLGTQAIPPHRVNLYITDEDQLSKVEEEIDTQCSSGGVTPTFRVTQNGEYTRATLTDTDFEGGGKRYPEDASSYMDNDCKFSDTASQPSVLEGDDDDSDVEIHDRRPLHPVV